MEGGGYPSLSLLKHRNLPLNHQVISTTSTLRIKDLSLPSPDRITPTQTVVVTVIIKPSLLVPRPTTQPLYAYLPIVLFHGLSCLPRTGIAIYLTIATIYVLLV